MRRIAVLNNKGGVGKSTISVQLAHGLAKMGQRVLLIDLDGQNDSSLFLGFDEEDYNKTFFDLIKNHNPAELEECIINARKNLDLLPNSNFDKIMSEFNNTARIDVVLEKKYLKELPELNYDWVFFDCSPTRNRINDAVLCYIDHIILPVQVEIASVRAVLNIYDYLDDLMLPQDLISLIIPNMLDVRTNDGKENLETLKQAFSDNPDIITEPINRRVKITEAGKYGKTVFEYSERASKEFYTVLEKVVDKIA